MYRLLTFAAAAVSCALMACSQPTGILQQDPPGLPGDLDSLPAPAHQTSANERIYGTDYLFTGPGTVENTPSLDISAESIHDAWALYGYTLPGGLTLDSLEIDINDITGDFWVALPDFAGSGSWDFFGPYQENCLIDLSTVPSKYLDPDDVFYWAVVTSTGCSVSLHFSLVGTTGTMIDPIFRVPPPGTQIVYDGLASDPYVMFMDDSMGTAENGAPIVMLTVEDEGEPNSHFAWYNGTAWEHRPIDRERRFTHTRGYWAGDHGLVRAFNPNADNPADFGILYQLHADENLNLSLMNPDKICYEPDLVDYDCIPELGQDVLMIATRGHSGNVSILLKTPTRDYIHGSPALDEGWMVNDLAISYAPDGTSAWAMYVIGQTDPDRKRHQNQIIKYKYYNGSIWEWSQEIYFPDEETIGLDVHHSAAGDPELLVVSARDYQLYIPEEFSGPTTLFQDIALGTYHGTDWSFSNLFTGTIDDTNKDSGELGLNLGIDLTWAGDNEINYVTGAGTATFTITPDFHYTGGSLATETSYLVRDGGGFTSSTFFPTGPGLNHTWLEGPNGMACVYVNSTEIELMSISTCEIQKASGNIVYWSP